MSVNNSSFHVRRASIQDVEGLQQFIDPFVAQGRLLPRTKDELEDLTENGFLAVAGDRIVGFAALEIYSTKLAELRSLAVSSDFQGQGIGKALVTACVELAREIRAIRPGLPVVIFSGHLTGELYHQARDAGVRVANSVTSVQETLLEGALLTVVVVFLFLGNWRATIIPAVAVPVSLIGTFAVLLADDQPEVQGRSNMHGALSDCRRSRTI